MLVRELRPSDFEDVVGNYFSYFPEREADPSFGLALFRKQPSVDDERKWFSVIMKEIEAGNQVARVAEIDSRVVGMCDVMRTGTGTEMDHRGYLGIAILKEFRGRGVGTLLMKETLDACRGRFEVVYLSVFSVNRDAIRLYERLGFRRYGTFPGAVKRDGRYLDLDQMYLKL